MAPDVVRDTLIPELVQRLRAAELHRTANRLETEHEAGDTRCRPRDRRARKAIVRMLEDCPPELAELRAVLLQAHVARVRGGLVQQPEANAVDSADPASGIESMNETLRVGLAVIVVTLLIVAVAGLGSLGLLALLGVALDAGVLNETAIRAIVVPFTLFVVWGVRVFPPALAARARSQGRYLDEASILRATRIVYVLLGALVLAAFVYVLLQQFSPAEVFKILVLPPVVVGGGFLTLMYADMAGGRSGWTLALAVLAMTAGLTWLILQV